MWGVFGQVECNLIERLGSVRRQGWLKRGIPETQAETGREHTLKVVAAAYIVGRQRPYIDTQNLVYLAGIHDICDILGPDITPDQGISEEEKNLIEYDAVLAVTKPFGEHGKYIAGKWKEAAEHANPEARLLHELDKIDPAIMAMNLLGRYPVEDFIPYAFEQLRDRELIVVFDRMCALASSKKRLRNHYNAYFSLLRAHSSEV